MSNFLQENISAVGCYGYTKLETPVAEVKQPKATVSTGMGDHSSAEVDAVVTKFVKSSEAEKRSLQLCMYMLLGPKKISSPDVKKCCHNLTLKVFKNYVVESMAMWIRVKVDS